MAGRGSGMISRPYFLIDLGLCDREFPTYIYIGGTKYMSRKLLVSNNAGFKKNVPDLEFVKGSSFDVLVRVRDYVHQGWALLTHPLYGNLRPYQHPFRSIVIQSPVKEMEKFPIDAYSLNLIENALSVYRSCLDRLMLVSSLSDEMLEDYSCIDRELLKESLEKYSMIISVGE